MPRVDCVKCGRTAHNRKKRLEERGWFLKTSAPQNPRTRVRGPEHFGKGNVVTEVWICPDCRS